MPTPIDRALQSRNLFLGFAGTVVAAAAWSIWGGDMFPAETKKLDPNPDNWTKDELVKWLKERGLLPSESMTKEQLVERVRANLRP